MPLRSFGSVSKAEVAAAKILNAPAIPQLCSTTNFGVTAAGHYGAPVKAANQIALITFSLPVNITSIERVVIEAVTGIVYNPLNPMHVGVMWVVSQTAAGTTVLWEDITLPVTPISTNIRIQPTFSLGPTNPLINDWMVQLQVWGIAAGGGHELTDLDILAGTLYYI